MNFYRDVKTDFSSFCENLGIKAYFLKQNTKLNVSIRFDIDTTDIESFDDNVDVVRVNFNVNLYAPDNEVTKWSDIFETSIRDFEIYDFELIGTEKEVSGGYNTAFVFSKNYFRG